MTAAHTPGPWEVEPAGADGNSDYGMRQMDGTRALLYLHINAPGAGGGRIGRCFSNCLVTSDEQLHANARVMAAGPTMLALLAKARQQLPLAAASWNEEPQYAGNVDSVLALIAEIDAAIAAATGAVS